MTRSDTIRSVIYYSALILLLALCSGSPAHATGSHPSPPSTMQPSKPASSHSLSNSAANSKSSSAAASKSKSDSTAQSSSRSSLRNSGNSQSTAIGGAATGGQANASANVGNVSPTQISSNSATGGSGGTSISSLGPVTATTASTLSVEDVGNSEVNVHGDTFEAPRTPVATAIAGGTNTTADCRYSVGAGGQAAIAGLSFGFGRKDRDCERISLADRFYAQGNADAGDVIMCRVRELREAFGADCIAWLQRSRVRTIVVQPATMTERQRTQREAFERGEHLK